jgi:hypothetical protein
MELVVPLSFPPHSDGEVSASYADGGVRSHRLSPLTPPSPIRHFRTECESAHATPPHLNGEEGERHG